MLLLVPIPAVGFENFGGAGGGGIESIVSVIQSMLFAPCIVFILLIKGRGRFNYPEEDRDLLFYRKRLQLFKCKSKKIIYGHFS